MCPEAAICCTKVTKSKKVMLRILVASRNCLRVTGRSPQTSETEAIRNKEQKCRPLSIVNLSWKVARIFLPTYKYKLENSGERVG